MTRTPLRSLVVADDTAWPRDTGYRQRLHGVVRALGRIGPVDYAVVGGPGDVLPEPPAGLLASARALEAPWHPRRTAAVRWARRREPHWVGGRNWSSARAALAGLAAAPDLVWVSHLDVWAGVRSALPGAVVVVDLDNVMSAVTARRAARSGPAAAVLLREEARRWVRLEQQVAFAADAVVVCSALDADRLPSGRRRPVVVPNGYDATPALGPSTVAHPRLLLVASFDYPPNAEAAVWAAKEILPAVRAEEPGAVLRLVGRTGPAVEQLRAETGVEVVGRVDDVQEELRDAAVVVCPVRSGGGTRIKVLEAFSARRPVVSTRVGCEGLSVTWGQDVLLGDDAATFAQACLRLLRDASARHDVAEAGHRLWDRSYRWSSIEQDLAEHLIALVDEGPGG